MPIHLSSISIDRPGFLGGGQWSIRNLNAVNILLGRNGSGKSQLLRSLRDASPASSHYVVPERTGEINFEPGLMVEVGDPTHRRNRSVGNFSSNYRQEVVTRIQAYYTKRGTKRIGEINHDPDQLLQTLGLMLPDFTVRVKSVSPFYELQRVKDGSSVTSVSALSSGESQLLSLGMDILTIVGMWELDRIERRVLIVDEPDAHIHPDLQIKFADFLCHIEREFQVQIFVATHSTTLLSALGQFAGSNLSVLYMNPERMDLIGEAFSDVVRELSSLLGGHLLMGPLFAAPVLLVEGDDDYRVWIQVARSGHVNLCVLPCNGEEIKRYQRSIERMFTALSENAELRGIALLDGDKSLPTPQPGNLQRYVRFARLECHETENLYLTDEVLAELGLTWPLAVEKLLASADQFGSKESAIRLLAEADRRTVDVKLVINEVAQILDPKGLVWTVRLGKTIGRGRPTGMLAEFIGPSNVDLFWERVEQA
jgi:energy-coupling factor transporter ATP-binding protein EcfA2